MGIGGKIRQLRERAGITQEELAERIGVTASAVGNYEREVSHPREEVMYRLFKALGCEPNDIFSDFYDSGDTAGQAAQALTPAERLHLTKYRSLDRHGRSLVDMCTDMEYKRCTASESGGEMTMIAARGNGAPHRIRLKKRDGAGSILDEPDYKGGRK